VLGATALPQQSKLILFDPLTRRLPGGWSQIKVQLAAWWQNPRLTWWVVAVLAVALGLRHPSALHTPQLWAEDGSVFLAYNDLFGLKAFTIPYAGYLHTIPHLVA